MVLIWLLYCEILFLFSRQEEVETERSEIGLLINLFFLKMLSQKNETITSLYTPLEQIVIWLLSVNDSGEAFCLDTLPLGIEKERMDMRKACRPCLPQGCVCIICVYLL